MKHARKDYARIQDPAGLIPYDEPVMLFRAQDRHAAMTVRYYADLLADDPAVAPEMVESVREWAVKMNEWPNKKVPDLPRKMNDREEPKKEAFVG